ncbi:MAG: right-handed parallel beta-helix repeat-containing protein [Planctomycetes bacterium]|nr:right-handed parallel beta-helix repeat-containing protein [Planctomycetota bacterium]
MNSNEIHVGPKNCDICGNTGRHIQIAIDALTRRGGGIIQLDAGEYLLSDSLRMGSNITIRGAGSDATNGTVLKRIPVVNCGLRCDGDKAQTQISPVDPSLFTAGMGVSLTGISSNRHQPRYITHIDNGILYLDDHLDIDYIAEDGAVLSNEFPMIHGYKTDNVCVENLLIEGGGPNDDGYGSPGIITWRCKHWRVSAVHVNNCVGDGLIFADQSCYGIVEYSEFSNCTNHGVHPGSHSAHFTLKHCQIHHNGSDGLYICWGITHSSFTDNSIHHNGWKKFRHGISIGHKDTDNLLADNHIFENWKHGLHVRIKTEANSSHRCIIRNNIIENNGCLLKNVPEQYQDLPVDELRGYGISLWGKAEDLLIEKNTIRETRPDAEKAQIHALYIGADIVNLQLNDNTFDGHPQSAIDDRR